MGGFTNRQRADLEDLGVPEDLVARAENSAPGLGQTFDVAFTELVERHKEREAETARAARVARGEEEAPATAVVDFATTPGLRNGRGEVDPLPERPGPFGVPAMPGRVVGRFFRDRFGNARDPSTGAYYMVSDPADPGGDIPAWFRTSHPDQVPEDRPRDSDGRFAPVGA